ncbi:cytochrome P450 2J6 [Trichonephila inaurata madagascariensis]|uniref:Cytochrome P450 2J6 n=1 Tax=Trichonephila inaurata madagascariensis TaxID=2747483 RepID=A0A8X6M921_9ARAC|nr:cytochrome P450 2J6 [Trichonephila inaurata madagascariensis]
MSYFDGIVTNFLGAFALGTFFWGKTFLNPFGKLEQEVWRCFQFLHRPQLMICVSDYELIKEILNHPLTLARPPQAFDFLVGKGGFSGQNGEAWQEQRRFVVQTMRNLGLGKGLWETMIQDDSAMLVKEIQKANGEPFAFNEPLAMSQISNSLSLLFGRHLDPETEKDDIEVIEKSRGKRWKQFSSVNVNIILPWLTKLMMLFNVLNYQDFINLLRKMEDIFK